MYDRVWPLNRNFVGLKETIIETQIVDPIDYTERSLLREFVRCGARQQVAFNPATVKAAIVTCGGLCPGLNTVIREIVMSLVHVYGADTVYGVVGGYKGFKNKLKVLTPENVSEIHQIGGTVLRSSRGGFDLVNPHAFQIVCPNFVSKFIRKYITINNPMNLILLLLLFIFFVYHFIILRRMKY